MDWYQSSCVHVCIGGEWYLSQEEEKKDSLVYFFPPSMLTCVLEGVAVLLAEEEEEEGELVCDLMGSPDNLCSRRLLI